MCRAALASSIPGFLGRRTSEAIKSTEDVLVFNLKAFIVAFLESESKIQQLYCGMAILTDEEVTDPWQATW